MERRSELSLVSLLVLAFFAIQLIQGARVEASAGEPQATAPLTGTPTPAPDPEPLDQVAFTAPYDEYWITQGLHGQSYGHLAIDLGGGRGATIKSPINGVVTERYADQYDNTVLVLENDIWRVTLFHGDYTVTEGEQVMLGQAVGTESNHGYTTDMQGRSCKNRDCGYHTHLNVFDKRLGENVDPRKIIKD